MWLSEKAGMRAGGDAAFIGTITIGGQNAGVAEDGEVRNLKTIAPGGFSWRPRAGQDVLVLKCGGEGEYVAGAVQSGTDGLESGEVVISSGAAKIRIRPNGSIELAGLVNITGALLVNGAAVGGE